MEIEITKRNGRTEPYDGGKLEGSIRASGVSVEIVKRIVDSIKIEDGISSSEIRRKVIKELKKIDRRSADSYEKQRSLTVRQLYDFETGMILVDNKTMSDLGLDNGDPIEIVIGSRTKSFKAHRSYRSRILDAYINHLDRESLKIGEGEKVVVRKPDLRI